MAFARPSLVLLKAAIAALSHESEVFCLVPAGSIEWLENGSRLRNKSMVKIDHAEEFVKFVMSWGLRKLQNGLHFFSHGTDTITRYVVTKEVELSDPKHIL